MKNLYKLVLLRHGESTWNASPSRFSGWTDVDLTEKVFIRTVDYFDTSGKFVKKYVDNLIRIKPLETIEFLVETRDTSGGSGAKFIVEWFATERIDQPIIEAVMVGATGIQGICFTRSGRNISSPVKSSIHE